MMPTWWISVADLGRPDGEQFLGAVITEAPTMVDAAQTAHMLGIGAMMGGGSGTMTCGRVPEQFESLYRPYLDRILDREEAEFVAAMQPLLS